MRVWLDDSVIGCRRAHRLEERATVRERVEECPEVADGGSGRPSQCRELARPPWRGDTEHCIRAEGRDHRTVPGGLADRLVMLEVVGRLGGGRQHFDVEAVEKRARPEFRREELLANLIVYAERRAAVELRADAEDFVQLMIEPDAGRSAAKEVV